VVHRRGGKRGGGGESDTLSPFKKGNRGGEGKKRGKRKPATRVRGGEKTKILSALPPKSGNQEGKRGERTGKKFLKKKEVEREKRGGGFWDCFPLEKKKRRGPAKGGEKTQGEKKENPEGGVFFSPTNKKKGGVPGSRPRKGGGTALKLFVIAPPFPPQK